MARPVRPSLAWPCRSGCRPARGRQAQADAEAQARHAGRRARWTLAGAVRELAAELSQLQAELRLTAAQEQELAQLAADVQRRVAAGDLARADALSPRKPNTWPPRASTARPAAARCRSAALAGGDRPGRGADGSGARGRRPARAPAAGAAAARLQLARERQAVMRATRSEPPSWRCAPAAKPAPASPACGASACRCACRSARPTAG